LVVCILLDVGFEGGESGLEFFMQVGEFGADHLSKVILYVLNDLVMEFLSCD